MTTTTVPIGLTPAAIFTPQVNATSVTVTNKGNTIVYIGGSAVTTSSGLPLQPSQQISLPFINTPLYAASSAPTTSSPTSALSAPASTGATALTVASGGASFTNGMIVVIIDGPRTELVTVGTGSTGTSVVVSATTYAHATGIVFGQLAKTNGAVVSVTAGGGN